MSDTDTIEKLCVALRGKYTIIRLGSCSQWHHSLLPRRRLFSDSNQKSFLQLAWLWHASRLSGRQNEADVILDGSPLYRSSHLLPLFPVCPSHVLAMRFLCCDLGKDKQRDTDATFNRWLISSGDILHPDTAVSTSKSFINDLAGVFHAVDCKQTPNPPTHEAHE